MDPGGGRAVHGGERRTAAIKILISADMEGVSGVVHRAQLIPPGADYEMARKLMTGEVNAAVEAVLEAGATTIVVADSHGGNEYRNILPSELHPAAQLITGGPRPMGHLDGLDPSFAMVALLGYHVRHGAFGVLDHTTHGQAISRVVVNGRELGEIGLDSFFAGHYGVPVGVVSGDDRAVAEALGLLPWAKGAVVKWALGRNSARCLAPLAAQTAIRQAITEALRDRAAMRPLQPPGPVNLQVTFKDAATAQRSQLLPGAVRTDDLTVAVTADDYPAAMRSYEVMISLWHPPTESGR